MAILAGRPPQGAPVTRTLQLIALISLFGSPVGAQDWREQLKSEVVSLSGGKMLYDEVGLYKITIPGYQPAQLQVKVHSEAPHGGPVSRDSFVALTTSTFTIVFLTALAESYRVSASQFMEGLDYTELKSAIGTPDMELNLVMTNEGMQLEIVNTSSGQRTRQTMTWDQVFAK